MEIKDFVDGKKTLLIAPAGYGKTHTIANCLQYAQDNGLRKQLVLTHTHAGVSSIKQKITKNKKISASSYNVETISGFAQKYVLAFYSGKEMPKVSSSKYFDFIQEQFVEILKKRSVKSVISLSYGGIFVDEYQDCSTIQHGAIMLLSDFLPTHILGDPLQGIFDFKGEIVDFSQLDHFENIGTLTTPYRWINAGSADLGNALHAIRGELEKTSSIELNNYANVIDLISTTSKDSILECTNIAKQLKGEKSILILAPNAFNVNGRKKIKQRMHWLKFGLLESFDSGDYYTAAKKIDNLLADASNFKLFLEILNIFFLKGDIGKWFNDSGVKNKHGDERKYSDELGRVIVKFQTSTSAEFLLGILKTFVKRGCVFGFRVDRNELWDAIISSLKIANLEKISVSEALVKNRNSIRRLGRSVTGRHIGTTLLTKGLEFDIVILLDAHKMTDLKNFYVAITRASKRLIILSEHTNLQFSK